MKTVGELLEALKQFDPDLQIRIFDSDTGDWLDVVGPRLSDEEDVEDGGAQADHPFVVIGASS
jgi:hypothetical protein